jgi:hypothetical protein
MDSPPATNPQLTARKRGLWILGIALVLLLLALLLLAGLAPAVGARYPLWLRIVVYILGASGWAGMLAGLFRVIVGPGTGALAVPLKLIAVLVVIGGLATGGLGAWILHAIVNEPRPASDGHHHHHDWD